MWFEKAPLNYHKNYFKSKNTGTVVCVSFIHRKIEVHVFWRTVDFLTNFSINFSGTQEKHEKYKMSKVLKEFFRRIQFTCFSGCSKLLIIKNFAPSTDLEQIIQFQTFTQTPVWNLPCLTKMIKLSKVKVDNFPSLRIKLMRFYTQSYKKILQIVWTCNPVHNGFLYAIN